MFKTAKNDSISRPNSQNFLFPGTGRENLKCHGKGREIWGLYSRESRETGIPTHPCLVWIKFCNVTNKKCRLRVLPLHLALHNVGHKESSIVCGLAIRDAYPFQNGWIFGKVPNGLWPPAPLIFGKLFCNFFPKFMTEVSSIMAKICNIIFWIENDPPPLELFRKFIRFGRGRRPLW